MEYLKLFENHSQYEDFIQSEDFIKPNVSHCIQENEVHYNPIPDPYNGHEYVDLGLTSGTKWAKMNVGASSETDAGLYFAWGETQGYTASQVGNGEGQKAFSWNDYALTEDSGSTMSKYNASDNKTHLELTDDAAAANMGGDWHMPNRAQCLELFKETKNGFVTNAGAFTQYAWDNTNGYSSPTTTTTTATISGWNTAGYFFFKNTYTSVTDAITAEDYLFIPAAGLCGDGEVDGVGIGGNVWASALNSESVEYAWGFYFNSDRAGVGDGYRCGGLSVRGVVGNLIYIERINNGTNNEISDSSNIEWDEDSATISVTLSDVVTADNVQISMSQSSYNGVATATSVDGKTWTATINTKSGWSRYNNTTIRIWSDSFDNSIDIPGENVLQ